MRHFLYQSDEDTCGLACLRMLLIVLKKQRSYRYLTLEDKPPYSLLSLKEAARKEGVDIVWKEASRKSDLASNASWPILLILESRSNTHMVLAKKSKKDKILIYDPDKGKKWIQSDELIENWTGKFGECSLIEGEEGHKIEKSNPFPIKDYLIPAGLSLLSVVFMALAFYFIKDDGNGVNSYLFPLTFFGLFAIAFILKRNYMMRALKRFDTNHLQEIYEEDMARFKKNYVRYYSFKKTNYPDYIALFEGMVTTASLLVLFGLNDPFFVFGGMMMLLYEVFASLVLRRKLGKREMEIMEGESLLFGNKRKEEEVRASIEKLNEDGYKFADGISAIRLVAVFYILVVTILHIIYSGRISLNFFLFNFFTYFAISEGYKNVFAFFENGKTRQIDFLYFLEHFDDHPPSSLFLSYDAKK